MNAIQFNRDLRLSVEASRRSEAGLEGKSRGRNTVTLPEMRRGRSGCASRRCSPASTPRGPPASGAGVTGNRTHETAYAVAQGMLAYYRLLEQTGELRQIRSGAEVGAAAGLGGGAERTAEAGRGVAGWPGAGAGDGPPDRLRAGDGGGGLHRLAVAAERRGGRTGCGR